MQQLSQSTAARAAAVTSKSTASRRIEAARALSAAAERARYVEPGLARLLEEVPVSTIECGRTK